MNTFYRMVSIAVTILFPLIASSQIVTVETDFRWIVDSQTPYGQHLKVSFVVPAQRTASNFSAGSDNFTYLGLSELLVTDGGIHASLSGWAGWFDYGTYKGIDVRMGDVFRIGDSLQLVVPTPINLFSGGTSNPSLDYLHLEGLDPWIEYYAPNYEWRESVPASNGLYDASPVVPEPSTYGYIAGTCCIFMLVLRRWHGLRVNLSDLG